MNMMWKAYLNNTRAHGRTATNHNKLSQTSFGGPVMNLPLFMHDKLPCEDGQSQDGADMRREGFITALHYSRLMACKRRNEWA